MELGPICHEFHKGLNKENFYFFFKSVFSTLVAIYQYGSVNFREDCIIYMNLMTIYSQRDLFMSLMLGSVIAYV